MELTTVAQFASQDDADKALRALRAVEIQATVFDSGEALEIRVPADSAYSATQLLADSSSSLPQSPAGNPICPECGSFETRRLPPYARIYLLLLVTVSIVLLVTRFAPFAFIVLVVGGPVFALLSRKSGKNRCLKCGWLFSN